MLVRWMTVLCCATVLMGCTTPYRPRVLAYGGAPFPGVAGLIEQDSSKQVDVLLVHGMCTHTRDDARSAIDTLLAAVDKDIPTLLPKARLLPPQVDGIEIETRTARIGKGTVRFAALVWSPLTAPLKQQLACDKTGASTDCAAAGECKPKRASINGALKDGLLNDCLADAMIYQGKSGFVIRQKMVNAIAQVIEDSQAQARAGGLTPGAFALVSDSLGSKMSFDALEAMMGPDAPATQRAVGEAAVGRLALIFMQANQMPILGLADQSIDNEMRPQLQPQSGQDSLQRLLLRKAEATSATKGGTGTGAEIKGASVSELALVAFTDPNDLLSYRLQPSRYGVSGVDVADVLVSNASTYFGFLDLPNKAHTDYRLNPEVTRLIACASMGSKLCR